MFNNKQVLTESSIAEMHKLSAETNQIKYAPDAVKGAQYGIGEWIMETNSQGNAASVAVPALNGIWPMIDLCRGYAFVVFTGAFSGDQKKDFYMHLKAIIDDNIGSGCQ